jgi:hypothetical protein
VKSRERSVRTHLAKSESVLVDNVGDVGKVGAGVRLSRDVEVEVLVLLVTMKETGRLRQVSQQVDQHWKRERDGPSDEHREEGEDVLRSDRRGINF